MADVRSLPISKARRLTVAFDAEEEQARIRLVNAVARLFSSDGGSDAG